MDRRGALLTDPAGISSTTRSCAVRRAGCRRPGDARPAVPR
jgi:hypothetical protein